MPTFSTVVGDSSWSKTKTITVNMYPSGTYSETFTHGCSVPTSIEREVQESTSSSWKWPESDRSSFRAIKKSGSIKMTDYDAGSRSVDYHVIARPRTSEVYVKRGAYTIKSDTFYDVESYLFDHTSRYYLQADYTLLKETYPDAPDYFHTPPSESVDGKVNDVMARVISELVSSYDLMTEVVESKQTIELVTSLLKSAVNPMRTIRRLMKKGSRRMIGDAWLKCRYGIMPITYSIRDLVKLYEERSWAYRVARASDNLNVNLKATDQPGICFYDTYEYKAVIRGTGKERIAGSDLTRLSARVQANPFATMWEEIPYSFVVDWFVNVGDWITAQSQVLSLCDAYTQRAYCYSVKVDKTRRVYFRDNHDDRRILSTGPWIVPWGTVFPETTRPAGVDGRADYELITERENSYRRRVFQPTQVYLALSPHLNWKRWADGVALTALRARDLLRRK